MGVCKGSYYLNGGILIDLMPSIFEFMHDCMEEAAFEGVFLLEAWLHGERGFARIVHGH
eukprot:c1203_g1_i1 orf=423-599(+)